MIEKNYIKDKERIITYLKKRQCFCFKKKIILDLLSVMTKNATSQTLREMRKRKEIKKAFRRWG